MLESRKTISIWKTKEKVSFAERAIKHFEELYFEEIVSWKKAYVPEKMSDDERQVMLECTVSPLCMSPEHIETERNGE